MSKQYRYRLSRHVAADPATVWDVVSNHADMSQWTPFRASVLETAGEPHPNGTGAGGPCTWPALQHCRFSVCVAKSHSYWPLSDQLATAVRFSGWDVGAIHIRPEVDVVKIPLSIPAIVSLTLVRKP